MIKTNVLVATTVLFSAATIFRPSDISPDLQKVLDAALYRVQPHGSIFAATNYAQHLEMQFHGAGTEFTYQGKHFSLSLVNNGSVIRSSASANRVTFDHGRVQEWFVNEPAGLEQGFTVLAPRSRGSLSLVLQTNGDLQPAVSGNEIVFRDASGTLLRYGGMRSWDVTGRNLPSRLSVVNRQIRLEVEDAGARYPVTVDPILQTAELIDPSPASPFDEFGSSVSVSGDGKTVLIGAPGVIDTKGASDSKGAAYVFERSGNVWALKAKLTAFDGSLRDLFGNAVALSSDGKTALIGAVGKNNRGGAAYAFILSGGTWNPLEELAAPNAAAGDAFGVSVALSADGNTALIGADGKNNGQGAAYTFTLSDAMRQDVVAADAFAAGDGFGNSVALSSDGNTALIGAAGKNNGQGAAYTFTRSGGTWSQQTKLTAFDGVAHDQFGSSVALASDGKTTLIGAPGKNNTEGAVYDFTQGFGNSEQELIASDANTGDAFGSSVALSSDGNTALIGAPGRADLEGLAYVFTLSGGTWFQQRELTASDAGAEAAFGSAVALSGEGTAFIGAPGKSVPGVAEQAGAAYAFTMTDVSVASAPSARSFTLSGTGCPSGTLTTPYTGLWNGPCTLTWPAPDSSGNTRYTFQNWSDGDTSNPRTITPQQVGDPVLNPLSANFLTEYRLTTKAQPATGGNLLPQSSTSNWYAAGTDAVVSASANPGFVFTGFSGALAGETSPQVLTMNSPQTVTGNFAPTPTASESGTISARSGPANARQWTINITNGGPGVAYNAQLVGLMLTQTFGKACTPVRDSPLLPVSLGDLALGASVPTSVTFDFSSCPANARFTVTVDYVSNGGASVGLIQLVNQLQ